jgi:hypothetical protein
MSELRDEDEPLLPAASDEGQRGGKDEKAYRRLRMGFYAYTIASEVRRPVPLPLPNAPLTPPFLPVLHDAPPLLAFPLSSTGRAQRRFTS